MKEASEIKLKYSKTIWMEYLWFLLYEFEITKIDFFKQTDDEILKNIVGSRILNSGFFHPEMENKEIEVDIKSIFRPFDYTKITQSDFQFLKSKFEFEQWLIRFRTEGWEDDRENAQIFINKAENEIWSLTNIKNGIWHLSKEKINFDSDKLLDCHWIYTFFETFVEIDRRNKLIRTFDFAYD